MTDILNHADKFVLILIRTSGVILLAPVFGGAVVPVRIKAAFVLVLSIVLTPVVNATPPPMESVAAYAMVSVRELLVGVTMGFTAYFTFGAFQIAGELIGRQMGFSMGEMADPMYEEPVSTLNQFHYILAMLIFLGIDGHQWFLQALDSSFTSIPLGTPTFTRALANGMIYRFFEIFVAGLKMAAPAICVLILVTIGLGMLARAAPLLNMLAISITLRIIVGMLVIGILMPYVYQYGRVLLQGMRTDLAEVIRAL